LLVGKLATCYEYHWPYNDRLKKTIIEYEHIYANEAGWHNLTRDASSTGGRLTKYPTHKDQSWKKTSCTGGGIQFGIYMAGKLAW